MKSFLRKVACRLISKSNHYIVLFLLILSISINAVNIKTAPVDPSRLVSTIQEIDYRLRIIEGEITSLSGQIQNLQNDSLQAVSSTSGCKKQKLRSPSLKLMKV